MRGNGRHDDVIALQQAAEPLSLLGFTEEETEGRWIGDGQYGGRADIGESNKYSWAAFPQGAVGYLM
jgi:hypothetical protein